MDTSTAHLSLYNTLADWEVGYLLVELRTGRFTSRRWDIVTVAEARAPITTMGGALPIPPGGDMWDAGGAAFSAAAGGFLDAGVPVAAICGATAGLARAGLLDQ